MADNDPTQNPEPGDPDVDFEPESDEPDIEDDEPDEMAQPFLDSRNSATYLYNARTGVISSYN